MWLDVNFWYYTDISERGRQVEFSGVNPNIIAESNAKSFVQGSNYLYIDTTSLSNTRVGATSEYLVRVADNSSTEVATLKLDTYSNGLLTLTVTLAEFWRISGTIIVK